MRFFKLRTISVLATACVAGGAFAQFVNGDFETGVLSPWTITPTANGQSPTQAITVFDVTGGGATKALQLQVGQVSFVSGQQAGVDVLQTFNLAAGTYTLGFDWAAQNTGTAGNAQGGVFSLNINGTLFGTVGAGSIAAGQTIRGTINQSFVWGGGTMTAGARVTRPFTLPGTLFQYVDNFRPAAAVPEPMSMMALGTGLALLARRRRKA